MGTRPATSVAPAARRTGAISLRVEPSEQASSETQARTALGEDQPPEIRLQDLRRANATITLTVDQHVHPGMGRQAADSSVALLSG